MPSGKRATSPRQGDVVARAVTLLMGLVLTGGGGAALSRSLGIWDDTAGAGAQKRADLPLLSSDVSRFFADHSYVWCIAILPALIVAYLGYRLIRRELRTKPAKARVVDLTDDPATGVTRVSGALATRALVEDLAAITGVEGASAAMRGDPAQPLVDVRLDVADDADLAAVLDEVEGGALVHLATSLDLQPSATTVEIRLAEPGGRRLG